MITKLIIIVVAIIILVGLYSCHPYRIVDKEKSDSYYFSFLKTEVHYVPMGNWFELGDQKLDSIDIKTIEVLGKKYIKDKNHVYFQSTKINNSDPASFVILNAPFAKDKNMIYYNSHSFQDLDINSFQFIKGDYQILKDKNHVYSVYSNDFDENSPGNRIIPFVPEKFQFLNKLYGKDEQVVYYKGKPIVGSDAKTFILLDEAYGKDGQVAYYLGTPIVGSDAKTFILDGIYAKDMNWVYKEGLHDMGVDPSTFTILDGGDYTKDKNGVYYLEDPIADKNGKLIHFSARIIVGADPATFTTRINGSSGGGYTKDKNRVYKWGLEVMGLDPVTFTLIDKGIYTKDKNGVYYDVNSNDDKDGKTISYTARKVVGADPETFIMIEGDKDNYAKDKARYYWRGSAQ